MADGARYRRRRFAAFTASGEAVTRKPHPVDGKDWRDRDRCLALMQRYCDVASKLPTADDMQERLWGFLPRGA